MDYRSLNKIHRDKMKAISNNDYEMKWENPEFMDVLLGGLPEVRYSRQESDISEDIYSLKKLLSSYDAFLSDKDLFIKDVSASIKLIQSKKASWHGLYIYEVEECIHQHEFCLISGEGGIGKSYFIKCFEERLESKKIPHLCVYGKFEKNLCNIDIAEIKECNSGFVFIIDGLNEMSELGQKELLQVLSEFKKNPTIRIVITYRSHALEEDVLKKYKNMASAEYTFPGVSFESALSALMKMSVPDVYRYEDILYSNNALLLNMLCNVLADSKMVNETENGIASVTFILEQYIKNSIGKRFKNEISCQGVDIWDDTKKIAQWMYKNNEKKIDEASLMSVIKTGKDYLSVMIQLGFIGSYEAESVSYFYFLIDSLTDFLIARSLFKDIKDKNFDEQVEIIKNKVGNLYNLEEAIIIAIFDNWTPDYVCIQKILSATGLIERFYYETIVKINFKKENIRAFLQVFNPTEPNELLAVVGGFTDKPFNCTNYLKNYYFEDTYRWVELSKTLSGYHFLAGIKNRLKNILYFTTFNNRDDRRDEEAYSFSLLCCASPNKDVRCLAMKLLYEIATKKDEYKQSLICDYYKTSDFYVKESAIYVLSQVYSEHVDIRNFFEQILLEEEYLSAKSIKRISISLGNEYGYIRWNRKNLYRYNENACVSDYLSEILSQVDLMNKDFLPFRYWGEDHIDMHTKFLASDKKQIGAINKYLDEKYGCVRTGHCNGWVAFEKRIMSEIESMADISTLDMNSFFESYEVVFRMVFDFYQVAYEGEETNVRMEDFSNSLFMKCVDIATGLYYGSLMCNYYTNKFATYNNYQNSIGYEVYDPLEYGEEIVITAPIPTYQDFVERLGEYVVQNIDIPNSKDIEWVKNVQLTRRNVLSMQKPVEVKHIEWVLLAARISLHGEEKYDMRWKDTYDIWCCTSSEPTILNDGAARYLTIELEEYSGSLQDYINCDTKPWLCKDVKNIDSQSDVFDNTSLVLPPADLIKYFKLSVNVSDLSWYTSDGVRVIICNNNKNSYYKDPIGGTVFIRKDYLEKYMENHTLKYFAFTERFIPKTGYADETSLHFEISNGRIVKEITNDGGGTWREPNENPLCKECPYLINTSYSYSEEPSDDGVLDYLKELLGGYGETFDRGDYE